MNNFPHQNQYDRQVQNRDLLRYWELLFTQVSLDHQVSSVWNTYFRSQHEKAVVYFQRALKLNPGYLSALTLMGHEYMEMKNTHAAIQSYRQELTRSVNSSVTIQQTGKQLKWTDEIIEHGMGWGRPTRYSRCHSIASITTNRYCLSPRLFHLMLK